MVSRCEGLNPTSTPRRLLTLLISSASANQQHDGKRHLADQQQAADIQPARSPFCGLPDCRLLRWRAAPESGRAAKRPATAPIRTARRLRSRGRRRIQDHPIQMNLPARGRSKEVISGMARRIQAASRTPSTPPQSDNKCFPRAIARSGAVRAAPSAERTANSRDAAGGTRQQQAGHIGASDQQDKRRPRRTASRAWCARRPPDLPSWPPLPSLSSASGASSSGLPIAYWRRITSSPRWLARRLNPGFSRPKTDRNGLSTLDLAAMSGHSVGAVIQTSTAGDGKLEARRKDANDGVRRWTREWRFCRRSADRPRSAAATTRS